MHVHIYIKVKFVITILPSIQIKRNARMETCVSMQLKPASGLLELDAEIVAASKKENTKSRLQERQKGMGDLI